MGLRCIIRPCKEFEYSNKNHRKCIHCGEEQVFVSFYPDQGPRWMEKEYVDRWGSYERLISVSHRCEACGRELSAGEDCPCNAC